ncbi:MAG: cation diffusion facilitator family transporter [Spirochaetia bacterium]
MSHDHHHHDHHNGHEAREGDVGAFRVAFFLNLIFTVVELIGGLLTNSVAILSDAVHDLGDSISLLFSWAMERIAGRRRTPKQTFGYKRYSVLGAIVSAAVLLVGSIFVMMEAIPRLFAPETVHPEGMLPLAVAGIAFNLLAVLRLRGGETLNRRVVVLHLMEDVLGWIGVLVVSIVLLFADLPILDPILSVAVTLFVLSRIVPRLKHALGVFMQYAPADIDIDRIESQLTDMDHVEGLHDVHAWSLDGSYHLFSSHVVIDEDLSLSELEELKAGIKEKLAQWGIHHVTLEFESGAAGCAECDL